MSINFPILPQSWKQRYPFRLGTTSFIYPAGYLENVTRLGPHLDEIELLMFESQPASRPTEKLVQDLQQLGQSQAVTYNVHLPTDLALTHPDRALRHRACRLMKDFVTTLTPLKPTVYVLHLTPPTQIHSGRDLLDWQRTAGKSLEGILAAGLPPRRLALENLMFPFIWLAPLLERFDLGVCFDSGHLALQHGDLEGFLMDYSQRIVIAHLHGLRAGRDHGPLEGLSTVYQHVLAGWVGGFEGSVSLEVFGFEPLLASLACLDRWMSPQG